MKPFFSTILILLGVLAILLLLAFFVVLPWSDRWGATGEEVTQTLPGDDLVSGAVT